MWNSIKKNNLHLLVYLAKEDLSILGKDFIDHSYNTTNYSILTSSTIFSFFNSVCSLAFSVSDRGSTFFVSVSAFSSMTFSSDNFSSSFLDPFSAGGSFCFSSSTVEGSFSNSFCLSSPPVEVADSFCLLLKLASSPEKNWKILLRKWVQFSRDALLLIFLVRTNFSRNARLFSEFQYHTFNQFLGLQT